MSASAIGTWSRHAASGVGRMSGNGVAKRFNRLAKCASHWAGSPWAFCGAFAVVLVWAMTGPMFGFNDTWQLVINTGTTIVTFLMVFLIQHSQNADTAALHLKLDELIRSAQQADNVLLDMEEMDTEELEAFRQRYEALADKARNSDDGAARRNGDEEHPVRDAENGNGPGKGPRR